MREKRLGYAVMWALVLGAWFSLIFYGTDWIASQRPRHVPPHFGWELELPFIPSLTFVYLTIHLVLAIAPLLLLTRRELRALGLALCMDVLLAGIGFISYPAQLAFPPPPNPGAWTALFHFADRLNGDYNLVPSLHVALTVTCIAVYARGVRARCAAGFWLWAGAIAVSTLLTHQHHVIDVVAGWLLGILGARLYQRLVAPANQSQV